MARIAVGGIQHETNVFGPYKAKYEVFAQRDEWPPLCRGERPELTFASQNFNTGFGEIGLIFPGQYGFGPV